MENTDRRIGENTKLMMGLIVMHLFGFSELWLQRVGSVVYPTYSLAIVTIYL